MAHVLESPFGVLCQLEWNKSDPRINNDNHLSSNGDDMKFCRPQGHTLVDWHCHILYKEAYILTPPSNQWEYNSHNT